MKCLAISAEEALVGPKATIKTVTHQCKKSKSNFCLAIRKSRPLPLRGRQAARCLDGLTRELVRNSVVLPVNMTYGPGTASKSEGFP